MKAIKISDLKKDGLQTRVALDEATVCDYAEAMRNGDTFPPVKVFEDPCAGVFYLADGFHRVEAAMRAGRHTVEADVRNGKFSDALRYALGCNARHGKRVTNEDKQKALRMAWENRRELFGENDPTADWLAKTCGISKKTADRFYEQILDNVPDLTPQRQNACGRTYTMPTRPMRPVRPVRPALVADAEAPAHLVPTDRYGVEIPLRIVSAFGDDALAHVLDSISDARCAIRKAQADGHAQFAAVRQDALVQLDNAYNFVASAKPWCVCRMCQGQGCKACHLRGWQTEEEYLRNPKEFLAS